jgi:hypothetical protein
MQITKKRILGCLLIILIPILGCGIFYLYSWAISPLWNTQIQGRHEDFCTAIEAENWEIAYTYMSSTYKVNNSFQDFSNDPFKDPCEYFWGELEYTSSIGKSGTVRYGDIDSFFFVGSEYPLIKENGNWYFTGEYQVYVD